MDLKIQVENTCRSAKEASRMMSELSSQKKNECLVAMAERLEASWDVIESANRKDLNLARRAGLSGALLDRLKLDIKGIKKMGEALRQVANLPDPVGETIEAWTRPNKMRIEKVRVPIGVIAIIYESRPNVTVDAASLCFKSGNAVILRGGSEALQSNQILVKIMSEVLNEKGIASLAIQMLESTDREAIHEMLKMDAWIDLVIPRGGEGLIRAVSENSKIPVIKHYKGVCHVFVDDTANLDMAAKIVVNAKTQRPATCNAAETLLVHQSLKKIFLPDLVKALKEMGVDIRGCAETQEVCSGVKAAAEEDWSTEYLDLIMSVRVVSDVEEAVRHINHYGSMHSDTIVTGNQRNAEYFMNHVDSACVYHNVSTRFTDGYEFGFGAEIGISTDKIHARGPMGLRELTSYKYKIRGNGQLRS